MNKWTYRLLLIARFLLILGKTEEEITIFFEFLGHLKYKFPFLNRYFNQTIQFWTGTNYIKL